MLHLLGQGFGFPIVMQTILYAFILKYISVSLSERSAIDALYRIYPLKKGAIILEKGQYSNENFLILKGCVRTYYMIDGEEKTTSFHSEMEALTPACVISRSPSDYFISCVVDSVVAIANPETEAETRKKIPKLETFYRILSEELLARSQYYFDQYKTSSREQRYLNLIENRPDLIDGYHKTN